MPNLATDADRKRVKGEEIEGMLEIFQRLGDSEGGKEGKCCNETFLGELGLACCLEKKKYILG
jgi:hypothetical protein